MSISYLLYNTLPEHSLMNEWDKDESDPIAKSLEVQKSMGSDSIKKTKVARIDGIKRV